VKSIGSAAFNGCSGLTSVTLSNSVTSIGDYAIAYCNNLTEVYCLAEQVPDTKSNSFQSSNIGNATLHVPATSINAYKNASPWNQFKAIVPTGNTLFKLIYKVDDVEYKTYEVEYGTAITPESAPTKEGYTFSGWSEIPEKMPAKDVIVTGTFAQIAEIIDNLSYQINDDGISIVNVGNIGNVNGALKIEATVTIHGKSYMVTAISEGVFQGCTGITSLELPASIVSIGKNAFEGCTGLRLIKLGRAIKEIGSMAFANIFKKNAKSRGDTDEEGLHFYCEAEAIPVTATDAFDGSDISRVTLHVAYDLVEKYKTTAPWDEFKEIVAIGAGDANGDGKVTDEDVLEIENYIMGKPSGKFVFQNADANGDKKVNATDIVTVLNTILNNK
jgi:hypothetical protein